MKPLCLLASLAFLCSLSSHAQDLTANSIPNNIRSLPIDGVLAGPKQKMPHKKQRKWKKEHDRIDGHIDHALLKTMGQTTATIVTLLSDSCFSEIPFIPSWHGEFVSDKRSQASRISFGLECQFPTPDQSDNGGSTSNVEGNAQIRIMSNDFSILFRDTLYVNGKIFQTLKDTLAVKNGFPYCELPLAVDDTANEPHLHTRVWLVSATDNLPYIPVTRKEYLEEATQEARIEKNKQVAAIKEKTPLRSADDQKAEKERDMEEMRQTYSGAEREMRLRHFLESYRSDEDYQKEAVEKGTAEIDSTIHLMEHLQSHLVASELNKPAVVSVPAIQFEGFEDNTPGSRMLVKVNPAYFNTSLTGEKAQCFLVCWNYNPSIAVAADLDRQLNDKSDFKKLQGLLGN
jgi:hypothetical protein